jgi:membrane-anchored protein YejM (alkaline phosphatase superfamily)
MMSQFEPYREGFSEGKSFERDRELVAWAEEMFRERHSQQPLFLFLFLDSTHHNYSYPPEFEISKPVQPEHYNHMTEEIGEQDKILFMNRYKNSVRYVDHLLGRLMAAVDEERRKGNLILLVTGDHGEEFWDAGLWGHAGVSFANPRVQVPLLFCLPDGQGRDVSLSSHVDLMPTLLDYTGLTPPRTEEAFTNGSSLLRSSPRGRYVTIGGADFPFVTRQFCLITDHRKYWISKKVSAADDYVLSRTTDLDDHPAAGGGEEQMPSLSLADFSQRFGRFVSWTMVRP